MKISASKTIAFGGLCALLAGAGSAAFAQGYDRQGGDNQGQDNQGQYRQGYDQSQGRFGGGQDTQYRQSGQYRRANQAERRRLDRLHAAYARAASHGNYSAAERAHLHAQAIRARLRAQRQDRAQFQDNGQGRDNRGF